MVCDRAGPGIKHCADREAEIYSVKQYQFKLSADFKRIIVRELPDFKERYLRDPKLDGPTGEKDTLRFSKGIVVSNAAEVKHRNSLLRLIGKRLREERRRLNATTDAEQRNRITYEGESGHMLPRSR